MVREVSAAPEWLRAFNRRRRRTYLWASIAAPLLVLSFLAKNRFDPPIGYWGLVGLLALLGVGVVVYGRWTSSERYCKGLPAARRYSAGATFHRCTLIGRPASQGWVDRTGVLVLDDAKANLCEARADLRVSSEVLWSEVESVTVARSRVRSGRFVELTARGFSFCLYCQASAVSAITSRLHPDSDAR
jgi:hypothetical protein